MAVDYSKIQELLGDDAETLLNYSTPGILLIIFIIATALYILMNMIMFMEMNYGKLMVHRQGL